MNNQRAANIASVGRKMCVAIASLFLIALPQRNAKAQMTLTPGAQAAGWTISDFATNFPADNYNVGPLGVAFNDAGQALVTDSFGDVRVFQANADNQIAHGAMASFGWIQAINITRVGSHIYMLQRGNSRLVELNADGSINHVVVTGIPNAAGMAVNPNTGHIYIGSWTGARITEVDPLKGTRAVILVQLADGLATDGITLWAASDEHIKAFRLSDMTQVYDSGYILGADGISLGAAGLSGSLIINTNCGQVFQMDTQTKALTLIGTGGSRGDFTAVAPNGTVLLTQSHKIVRLSPPTGSSFIGLGISLSPSSVKGGANAIGTVTVSTAAPRNLVIQLTTNNPAVTVPTSVTIVAGSNTASFTIKTKSVSQNTAGFINATLNGMSSAQITVLK